MFFGSSNTSSGALSSSSSIGGSYYNVKEVQNMLIKIGYPCGNAGADGIWGNDTYIAVKSFQKDCNLKSDGWVGNDTYHKIEAEYNKKMGIKPKQEIKKEEYDMDKIILYFGDMDALSALLISQKYGCPVMRESDFDNAKLKAKEIIKIGGPNGTATGIDRWDTFKAAGKLV
nr:peptidoglycan-binding domain-containing protein [Clostridium botulinum]